MFRMITLAAFILALFIVSTPAQDIPVTQTEQPEEMDIAKSGDDMPAPEVVATNYLFSVQAGIALEDMASGTTQLIAAGSDDTNSSVHSIGFLFRLEGITHTNFSANANGVVQISPTVISGANSGNVLNSGAATTMKFAPYWDNLCVGSGGKVHYKKAGTPGNYRLVVEWKDMKITRGAGCDGTGGGTFQLWIHEHTGVIQFVYGNGMIAPSPTNGGYSVGIAASANFASVTTAFGTVDFSNANDAQTNAITVGTSYLFTPVIPATPTNGTVNPLNQTSLTLNWADNANNEVGYYIRRSTTGAEDSYIHLGTLPANSTSFQQTGLSPGTQYFYIINAISNSAVSQDLILTPTTLPPASVNSTASGGNWSAPSTWANGVVPAVEDNVSIASGATVIIDTASAVAGNVTVAGGGTLRFGDSAAFTLTVAHNVTINAGGALTSGTGNANQHVLSVGGDLTNNGTLDLSTNNNLAGAGLTFTGAANNTFGGTGAVTDIRTLTINKGTTNVNTLELNVPSFTVQGTTTDGPVSGYLFLMKGTFKISGTFPGSHRTFPAAAYQISGAAGFWLNNPNYTVTPQNDTAHILGRFRITAGTYNVGTLGNNSFILADNAFAIIEGGTVNVTGRFGGYNGFQPLNYNQTGGTLTTCLIGHSSASLGCFDLNTSSPGSSAISMTGGDVVIVNHPAVAGAVDYRNNSTLSTLTDTTVHFGNAQTPAGTVFVGQGRFPNVHLDTTGGAQVLNMTNSTILRDLNIGPGGIFDAGNFAISLTGDTVINNGTFKSDGFSSSVTFGDGNGQTITYSGSGTTFGITNRVIMNCQSLTLDPGINNIRVRNFDIVRGNLINANKLTIGNNDANVSSVTFGIPNQLSPTGTLDTSPVFELGTGGQNLTYFGVAAGGVSRAIGPELNPARTLVNMTYDDAGTLTMTGGDITINGTLRLDRGVIVTGTDKLVVNGGVVRTAGYINGTLKWRLAQTADFTFHVGDGVYSPVMVTVTAFGVNPTYVTVKAVDATLPGLVPSISASRYWQILEEGDITGRLSLTYGDSDVNGNEANYSAWRSNGGPPTIVGSTANPGNNTVTTALGLTDFSGNWGVGETSNPGAVSISGQVRNAGGNGIPNATITVTAPSLPSPIVVNTGSLGFYTVNNLLAGETYTVKVSAKRFRFTVTTQVVTPTGNVTNVDFVANPQD